MDNFDLSSVESRIDTQIIHSSDNSSRASKFRDTVLAVYDIIERKLYKEKAMNIEQYFKLHWNISRAQAYRLYNCGSIVRELSDFEIQPTRERYCRIIRKITSTAEERKVLWGEILKRIGNNETLLTTAMITSVWNNLMTDSGENERMVLPTGDPLPPNTTIDSRGHVHMDKYPADSQPKPSGDSPLTQAKSLSHNSSHTQQQQTQQAQALSNAANADLEASRRLNLLAKSSIRQDSHQFKPYRRESGRPQQMQMQQSQQSQQGRTFEQQQHQYQGSGGQAPVGYRRPTQTSLYPTQQRMNSLQPQQMATYLNLRPSSPLRVNSVPGLQPNDPVSQSSSPRGTRGNWFPSDDFRKSYRSYSISTQATDSPLGDYPRSTRSSIVLLSEGSAGSNDEQMNMQLANSHLVESHHRQSLNELPSMPMHEHASKRRHTEHEARRNPDLKFAHSHVIDGNRPYPSPASSVPLSGKVSHDTDSPSIAHEPQPVPLGQADSKLARSSGSINFLLN